MEQEPVAVAVLTREGWHFSEPMKIEDIEQRSLNELNQTRGKVPHLPFGGRNSTWEHFKSSIRDGDAVVYFRSPDETWDGVYGRSGYALIRAGIIVDAISTLAY